MVSHAHTRTYTFPRLFFASNSFFFFFLFLLRSECWSSGCQRRHDVHLWFARNDTIKYEKLLRICISHLFALTIRFDSIHQAECSRCITFAFLRSQQYFFFPSSFSKFRHFFFFFSSWLWLTDWLIWKLSHTDGWCVWMSHAHNSQQNLILCVSVHSSVPRMVDDKMVDASTPKLRIINEQLTVIMGPMQTLKACTPTVHSALYLQTPRTWLIPIEIWFDSLAGDRTQSNWKLSFWQNCYFLLSTGHCTPMQLDL